MGIYQDFLTSDMLHGLVSQGTRFLCSWTVSAYCWNRAREWMARLMLWRVFYRVRGQCQTPDAWHNNELPPHSPCQDALALERLTLLTALSLPQIRSFLALTGCYFTQPKIVMRLGTLLVFGSFYKKGPCLVWKVIFLTFFSFLTEYCA